MHRSSAFPAGPQSNLINSFQFLRKPFKRLSTTADSHLHTAHSFLSRALSQRFRLIQGQTSKWYVCGCWGEGGVIHSQDVDQGPPNSSAGLGCEASPGSYSHTCGTLPN